MTILINSIRLLSFFIIFSLTKGANDCLNTNVDEKTHPKCTITDHSAKINADGTLNVTYICLQWENSIYLTKESIITIECTAPFPIDFKYDGVIPNTHLELEFFKKFSVGTGAGLTSLIPTYAIRVLVNREKQEWSGNYIFYGIATPNLTTTVFLFRDRKYTPLFQVFDHDNPIVMSYVDESENAVVLPCRSGNYQPNKLILYNQYRSQVEIDGVDVRYDPRKGILMKIKEPSSDEDEDDISTLYECFEEFSPQWNDRMKIFITEKAADKARANMPALQEFKKIEGTIKAEVDEESDKEETNVKGICSLPNAIKPIFSNTYFNNPTSARINLKCSNTEIQCGDVGQNRKEGKVQDASAPNTLSISGIYNSGTLRCADSKSEEIVEYFVGADDKMYSDWNSVPLTSLVRVKPLKKYEGYKNGLIYEFRCHFPNYIGVKPIWWGIGYENGTLNESLEEESDVKNVSLTLETISISCGMSLWNASDWYTGTLEITVTDSDSQPAFKEMNTTISMKKGAKNQVVRCEIEPQQNIILEWHRNGVKVNMPTLKMGEMDSSLLLFFDEIKSADGGNYTCVAMSKSIRTEIDFKIVVNSPEEDLDSTLSKKENEGESEKKCGEPGSSLIYHLENEKAVESTGEMKMNKIFFLKFIGENCQENETKTLDEKVYLKRVLLEDSLAPQDVSEDYGKTEIIDEDDDKYKKKYGPEQPFRFLLPFLFGIGTTLTIVIIAYGSYNYYVGPWKVTRISTVYSPFFT